MQSSSDPQRAARVLLVRPAAFGYDPETAGTNAFQRRPEGADAADIRERARREVEGLAAALEAAGVRVLLVEDEPDPPKPDAAFPNNWFTTHDDGTLVLYPMQPRSRRAEVRPELLRAVADAEGLRIERVLDLRAELGPDEFLEGTGSLVLDRAARVAYACRSARTTAGALARWGERMGHEVLAFDALDAADQPVYHTNVCLSIGARFAVACLDAVPDEGQRAALRERLEATGRELVAIDRAQMADFCANVLELRAADGSGVLAVSARARAAFRPEQLATLARHARVVAVPAPTLETCGGGGVRCALAELFLPERRR